MWLSGVYNTASGRSPRAAPSPLDVNLNANVSAIVPARNEEATIAGCLRSLADQPEIREIIVVNDQSTDGTAGVLANLAAAEPKLCVIEAGPLPAGWVGKNHAAWLGAQQASGAVAAFHRCRCHSPARLDGAWRLRTRNRTAPRVISYSPAQEMHTWWERALIPFIFCRLSQLYPYAAVNDPESPRAAANGQYLLIRRDAYEAIGGHAAVCGEVLEDVALAQRAKEAGLTAAIRPGRADRARQDVCNVWSDVGGLDEKPVAAVGPSAAGSHPGAALGDPVDSAGVPGFGAAASDFWGAGAAAAGRAPRQLCRHAAAESFSGVQRHILSGWAVRFIAPPCWRPTCTMPRAR